MNESTVGSGGTVRDYSSLSSWESSVAGDFSTNGERALCYADGNSLGSVTLSGATNLSSTERWEIIPNSATEDWGKNFDGAASGTDPYSTSDGVYITNTVVGITLVDTHALIEGIQINCTADDNNIVGIQVTYTGDSTTREYIIDRCLIQTGGSFGTTYGENCKGIDLQSEGSAETMVVRNCLIRGFTAAGEDNATMALHMGFPGGSAARYVYNCTIVDCYRGIESWGGTQVVRNVIVNDGTGTNTNFNGSAFSAASDYNFSDDTSDTGGTNDEDSAGNGAVTFEDAASGDYRLADGSNGLDAGEDLSGITNYSFSVDALGVTRSGWSVGAFEEALSSGGGATSFIFTQFVHAIGYN